MPTEVEVGWVRVTVAIIFVDVTVATPDSAEVITG